MADIKNEENITFFLNDETGCNDDELMDLYNLQNELNELEIYGNLGDESGDIFLEMKDYEMNYTVKQLMLICEYYDILKDIRTNKLKKQDIIEQLLLFEKNVENVEITMKRKELWYYISELKNDKMMKKFVIWG
uniref:Uncharacterized protein n=1 Tax=viral metagenome TaxID=1070528 RepID=A0A6C0JYQ4_9ZZZZ